MKRSVIQRNGWMSFFTLCVRVCVCEYVCIHINKTLNNTKAAGHEVRIFLTCSAILVTKGRVCSAERKQPTTNTAQVGNSSLLTAEAFLASQCTGVSAHKAVCNAYRHPDTGQPKEPSSSIPIPATTIK